MERIKRSSDDARRQPDPLILPIRALHRNVASNDAEAPLPMEDALVLLAEAEEARREADSKLNQVLVAVGFNIDAIS